MSKEERMLDYNEFIDTMNCDMILRDFNLTVEGKTIYRYEQEIKYLKPGESMYMRYNEDEDDFEMRYIKTSKFSPCGHEVYIELY